MRAVDYAPNSAKPMHRHESAYVAVVLEGAYFEASISGREVCEAGNAVFHPPYDLHANRFGDRGARVIDIPVPPERLGDAMRAFGQRRRAVLRSLPRDGRGALDQLLAGLNATAASAPSHWCDDLAEAARREDFDLRRWRRARGLSAAHVSRTFKRRYGITPSGFHREARLRTAIDCLMNRATPAAASAAGGFADQAHFTRSLTAAVGLTPGQLARAWRGYR